MTQVSQSKSGHISLEQAAEGIHTCISVSGADDATVRLKRLGICTGQEIAVLAAGDPMIVRVAGARIAVSRHLAASVIVTQCPSESQMKNEQT